MVGINSSYHSASVCSIIERSVPCIGRAGQDKQASLAEDGQKIEMVRSGEAQELLLGEELHHLRAADRADAAHGTALAALAHEGLNLRVLHLAVLLATLYAISCIHIPILLLPKKIANHSSVK